VSDVDNMVTSSGPAELPNCEVGHIDKGVSIEVTETEIFLTQIHSPEEEIG
jgi:hypothetical protein